MSFFQRQRSYFDASKKLQRQEALSIAEWGKQEYRPVGAAKSLNDILRWRAAHQPEKQAFSFLVDGDGEEIQITYEELDRRARAIAYLLQSFASPGERALLIYPPGLDFITGFFGCLYAGVIAIPAYPPDPVRPDRTLPRLQAILADAQATLVLTTTPILSLAEMLFSQAPDLGALQWMATDRVEINANYGWREPSVTEEYTAILQYTSGSTHAPRGVMVTHGNLLYNSRLITQSFGMDSTSACVSWLPPYHDIGLIGGILQPLYLGLASTLLSPLSFLQQPVRWLQAISRGSMTVSGGPNFTYDHCVRKVNVEQKANLDLSTWKVAYTGAEPVRAETLERFAEAFAPCGFRREAFYPYYGLAEATLFVCGGTDHKAPGIVRIKTSNLHKNMCSSAENDPKGQPIVSSGRSLAGAQIVIVDPETRRRCPEGLVGEIWVSGLSVAKGYWNRKEESEATFNAYISDTNEGPFLRTSDLGFIQAGELYVSGRLKDLIIIDGQNHYPNEIEATVEDCHTNIYPGGSAVFSIKIDKQDKLVVVAEYGGYAGRNGDQTAEDVITLIHKAIAARHALLAHDILLVRPRSLPKTHSGKIQRQACKEGYLSQTLEVVRESH
jgi:acyl-CoA synthetase (AMP-forming)/AMP-acid ligase II